MESRTGYPAHAEVRVLKRRAGIAEETVRFKKERLDDAEQEYEDEHRTVTCFSKQLEEKWEQRFDALVRLALAAGVRNEDMAAVRQRPCRAVESVLESDGAVERAAREQSVAVALQQTATVADADKERAELIATEE